MKKYLMTVMAAVTLGGLFAGCSKDADLSGGQNSAEFNIVQNYENAFITRFGQPHANQTWGFGESVAGTRANNPGTDVPYTSDAINANANEWADPTPGKTYGGWVVPDPLTPDQKELVMKYFQAVPNRTYQDPHYRHFFIQQVYKGHDIPPTTGNHELNSAAGTSTYTSDNMNYLTVGHNEAHINDFNTGSCSSKSVGDNDYTVNDNKRHPDEISLMVNIDDTECFGYHNSGCSIQRNDKAGLVHWTTIRTWAIEQEIYDESKDILNDKWNRSFMGFDFELLSLEDSYYKQNGEKVYAKFSNGQLNGLQYVYYGQNDIRKRGTRPANTRPAGTRGGATVYGGGTIFIQAKQPYADGSSVYMYNGNEIVGKLIFHGNGKAAEENSALSSYRCTAFVERPYFTFKSLIDSKNMGGSNGQLRVYNGQKGTLVVYDETLGSTLTPQQNNSGYTANLTGGHTYKLYYAEDGVDLDLYGIDYYQQGNTIDDEDDDNQGGNDDNQGGNDDNQGGNNDNQGGESQSDDNYEIYDSEYLIVDGERIPFLIENKNMYGGVKYLTGDEMLKDADMTITVDGKECFNMAKIKELVDDGYLPVWNSNLRTWVKWGGGDGYYSDWIVTLTEAKRQTPPENPPYNPPTEPDDIVCRIIVEDLTVGESSDFDFNDVVFDVCKNGDLLIRAIGGELPIYIGAENANEVHAVCNIALRDDYDRGKNSHLVMMNTGWQSSGVGKVSESIDYNKVLGTIQLGGSFNSKADAWNIDIWVHKNGKNIKLEAPVGKVASMICVGTDYQWCAEREDIDKKFRDINGTKLFQQYVRGNVGDSWENKTAWYQYKGKVLPNN